MNKRLFLKEVYRDELLTLLRERSIADIADARYSGGLRRTFFPKHKPIPYWEREEGKPDPAGAIVKEHKDVLVLLYEIEYKHSMLRSKGFRGTEQRKENLLNLLEEVGRKAAKLIGKSFKEVFNWYLDRTKSEWEGYIKADEFDKEYARKFLKNRPIIEEIADKLENLESLPFEKQMALVNRAKNANHWHGPMLQYFYDRYNVNESFFREMSRRHVEDWNKELREIGVEI